MFVTVAAIEKRFGLEPGEDGRLSTIVDQQKALVTQRLAVQPENDPSLAIIYPIATEEICAGEYLLTVAGENVILGKLDISIIKAEVNPDSIKKLGRELRDDGWSKLKVWLKPDNPSSQLFFFGSVDG